MAFIQHTAIIAAPHGQNPIQSLACVHGSMPKPSLMTNILGTSSETCTLDIRDRPHSCLMHFPGNSDGLGTGSSELLPEFMRLLDDLHRVLAVLRLLAQTKLVDWLAIDRLVHTLRVDRHTGGR